MTAKEVKAQRTALIQRAKELEDTIAVTGRTPELRAELAGVKEDINLCNRRLRELVPSHRTRWGGTVSSDAGTISVNKDLYQKWFDAEMGKGDTTEDVDILRQSVRAASVTLSDKQRAYLIDHLAGMKGSEIGKKYGVVSSTVTRGLTRANQKIQLFSQAIETFRRHGGIDLGDEECLTQFCSVLTERQLIYLSLYYGEWMTMREIGDLLGTDHSSVSRRIRSALCTLSLCIQDEDLDVSLDMDRLEDMLIAHYNGLDPPAPVKPAEDPRQRRKQAKAKRRTLSHPFYSKTKAIMLEWLQASGAVAGKKMYHNPELMSGRFRQWLEELRQSAERQHPANWGVVIRETLLRIFSRVKAQLKGAT